MKPFLPICIALFLSAGAAWACPDFSGRYSFSDIDGGVGRIVISQSGCESVTYAGPQYKATWLLDGQARVSEGSPYVSTTRSYWDRSVAVTTVEMRLVATGELIGIQILEDSLLPNGDISETNTLQEGQVIQISNQVYHRL
jgi:hypothetical protein